MKAVTFSEYGDPGVLHISDLPIPEPQGSQLLIRVYATALNRADLMQRAGKYPAPKGESDTLGLEIAGEVVDWGHQVSGFKKGQRIFGLVGSGAYAEYCLIDQKMAITIPDQWTYTYAAAIPEAFFTAQIALFELGNLKEGESVLIHAAGSGVGTACIQMAKYRGAIVYGTASLADKIENITRLGADAAINYKKKDFAEAVLHLTQHLGVDVIVDFIGADYFSRNLNLLTTSGRLVQLATMSGARAEIDLTLMMRRLLQIKGFVLRSRSLAEKRAITQKFITTWMPVMEEGAIKPIIDSIYPLEQVRIAHHRMENNENFGKIILTI